MANTIIALKQSGATGNTPVPTELESGELAINFADGILYFKTAANELGSIRTTQPVGLSSEVQFNDAGSFGSDATFTFNKTTDTLNVANIIVTGTVSSSDIDVSGGITIGNINVASAIEANAAIAAAAFNQANTANTTDFTTVDVAPGTYGNSTSLLTVTVAANGRLTNVSTQAFEAATIGDVLAISIALG